MEKKTETHESYGMVTLHRQTGTYKNMFGSSIKSHHTTICMEISKGERAHDLSRDVYHSGKTILSLSLSPAQFAHMITNMNTCPGTPCTLERGMTEGFKKFEDPPDVEIEAETVRNDFEEQISDVVKTIDEAVKKAEDLLATQKTPGKKEWNAMVETLKRVHMEMSCNAPFVVDQFQAATEKLITTAKTEIDATLTTVINQTGLKALKDMQVRDQALLSSPDREESTPEPEQGTQKGCSHYFQDTAHCIKCGYRPYIK